MIEQTIQIDFKGDGHLPVVTGLTFDADHESVYKRIFRAYFIISDLKTKFQVI